MMVMVPILMMQMDAARMSMAMEKKVGSHERNDGVVDDDEDDVDDGNHDVMLVTLS